MPDIPFHPRTRAEYLAKELAERLGDPEGLPFYRKVATQYPESVLREMLHRVLAVPAPHIRTSRGALFNWLIQHYGKHTRA